MKPIRIPETWDARWFASFVRDTLGWIDDTGSASSAELIVHNGDEDAHTNAIDKHNASASAHAAAINAHNLNASAHSATIGSAVSTHDADAGAHSAAFSAHVGATDPHPDLIDDLTAATVVVEGDYVLVSQGGTLVKATLNQVTDAIFGDDWDDLVVPGQALNPAGSAAPPTLSTSTGLLEFSAAIDNVISFVWQLPHGWSGAWDASKAIVIPHLHVRHLTATTSTSRWKFEYDKASVNGSFANAYGSFTTLGTVSSTNPNDTTIGGIVSFGNLDMTGHGVSTILHGKVSRLASSDGADDDASVIALYSADLHIRRRRWGTENEYTD